MSKLLAWATGASKASMSLYEQWDSLSKSLDGLGQVLGTLYYYYPQCSMWEMT